MSEEKDSSEITGKKVFLLFPSAPMRNQVITELIQHEIEVYIAKDHGRLSYALKKYNNSILYINIDERLTEPEWEKWIFTTHSAIPTVKLGVFSASTDEELKNKYINKMNITCGFMPLKLDMSKTTQKIMEIFDAMDVKGRRKYLRATIERDNNTSMNMPYNGDFINATVKDISVVGISCVFEHDPVLKKNSLFKDIQIRLQTTLLKVEAIVFGSREEYGAVTYVMLFTQRIDPDVRVKIRKYIQHSLQSKMDLEIN